MEKGNSTCAQCLLSLYDNAHAILRAQRGVTFDGVRFLDYVLKHMRRNRGQLQAAVTAYLNEVYNRTSPLFLDAFPALLTSLSISV